MARRAADQITLFRAALEGLPQGAMVTTPPTARTPARVVYANRAFGELVGRTAESLAGTPLDALVAAGAGPSLAEQAAAALRGASRFVVVATWRRPDGTPRSVSCQVTPLTEKRRAGPRWLWMQRDAAVASPATGGRGGELPAGQQHRLLSGGPVVVFRWRATEGWPVEYVSPNVSHLLGYAAEDFLTGRLCFADVIHPEDRWRVTGGAGVNSPTGVTSFEHEYRVQHAFGDVRWVRDFTVAVHDDRGRIVAYEGYVLDNTARKRAEEALRASEQRFRTLFANAPIGIARTTPDGRILEANPACVKMLGFDSFEELAHRNLEREGFAEYPRAEFRRRVEEEGHLAGLESAWVRRDGRVIYVRENAVAVRDRDGHVQYYDCTAEDITERRRTEQQVRENEQRFRTVFEAAEDAIFIKDRDLRYTAVNSAMARLLDRPIAAVLGRTNADLAGSDAGARVAAEDASVLAGHTIERDEMWTADGQARTYHLIKVPMRDDHGRVVGVCGIARDVTDRQEAGEALRRQRDFAESLIETAQTIVLVLDPEGRIVRFNPYMEELTGYRLAEVQGRDWFDTFLPAGERESIRALFRSAIVDIQTRGNVNTILTKDGRRREVEWYDRTLKDAHGQIIGLLAVGQDITERLRAERALQQAHDELEQRVVQRTADLARSEERWRSLVDAAPDFILLTDPAGTIQYINRTSPGISSQQVVGTAIYEHLAPDCHADVRRCIEDVCRTGVSRSVESMGHHPDGSAAWYSMRAGPSRQDGQVIGLTWIISDITLRHEAEEALQRSQRLASIGTLAAGIAHEINNPVGGILLSAQSALDELGAPGDVDFVRQCLREVMDDARRCGRIIQSVLRFSRRQPTEKWPNDLNALVRRVVHLTREAVSQGGGDLQLELAAGLPLVPVNPTEFEQVLVNLIQNAIEVGGAGTRVSVRTERSARCVRLLVSDNGPGITPQQAERIFDPFYTTRQSCGGTGLGLSVVHGIIQAHGGRIDVQSTPQRGTTFAIELPV